MVDWLRGRRATNPEDDDLQQESNAVETEGPSGQEPEEAPLDSILGIGNPVAEIVLTLKHRAVRHLDAGGIIASRNKDGQVQQAQSEQTTAAAVRTVSIVPFISLK